MNWKDVDPTGQYEGLDQTWVDAAVERLRRPEEENNRKNILHTGILEGMPECVKAVVLRLQKDGEVSENSPQGALETLVGVQTTLPIRTGEHHDFSLPSTDLPGEKFSTFILHGQPRRDSWKSPILFGRLWDTPVVPVLSNWEKICDPHGPTPVLSLSDGRHVSPEKQSGYIYFIQDGDSQRIKIGKAKDPDSRLDALQTANSGILTLLVAIPSDDMVEDEKYFHKKFEASRVRGEWFLNTPELVDFIEEEYDR